jgi:hypothetical protein
MSDAVERVRRVIRQRLEALSGHLQERFAALLADPPELEWGNLGLEIDPFSYRLTNTDSEDELLTEEQTESVFYDSAGVCAEAEANEEDFDYLEVLAEVFLNWLADCWAQAGGLNVPFPAEAFFHGYHLDRFDLRQREWLRFT